MHIICIEALEASKCVQILKKGVKKATEKQRFKNAFWDTPNCSSTPLDK